MPASEYESLREYIHPEYADLSDAELERVVRAYGGDAAAMEGFFDNFGKIASSIGQVALKAAPSILPIAGQVVGTAFGGPIGASIGGSLGSLAGQALGSATGQKPSSAGGAGGIGSIISGGLGALAGGSPAASQLLQTITKPETLSALSSMAMGALGKPSISVGGAQVPPTGFTNMLKLLTQQAEAEYEANMARVQSQRAIAPEYMLDYAGQTKADPAVAANRAAALYALLQTLPGKESEQESESEAEIAEQEAEAFTAEYDALDMELAELESEDA